MHHYKGPQSKGIRAKKHLGQHFLKDKNVAEKIVEAANIKNFKNILEIGPGTGVLTEFIIKEISTGSSMLHLVEYDSESVDYLKSEDIYKSDRIKIHSEDILRRPFSNYGNELLLMSNLPYNISSPVFFKIIEEVPIVHEAVIMIQKEVAERICSVHGNKNYGILSVLLQNYYSCQYLFEVSPESFIPAPKVNSAVIRLELIENHPDNEIYKVLKSIVKKSFNQRRKMIRNTLKYEMSLLGEAYQKYLTLRPEQISVNEFLDLARKIYEQQRTV